MVPLFFATGSIPLIESAQLRLAIKEVANASTKEAALRRAFQLIVTKYTGHRFYTYLLFWKAFETNPNTLWQRSGFLHCTQQNYLLMVLLISSGWFSKQEISLGYSLVWYISPHQFLRVKLDTTEIAVDPWNYSHGSPFGTYASGFGHERL